MATLKELLARQQDLARRIEEMQGSARTDAIEQIRTLMADHGLTLGDVVAATKPAAKKAAGTKGSTVAAKYRNPATGDTWSGRGLQPKWLRQEIEGGRKLEDFAV
jgi:DNA-binding protein H-NS